MEEALGYRPNYIQYSDPVDIADARDESGKQMERCYLSVLLYSCSLVQWSIGPESISGEKERGTIATLLVTPVREEILLLGKS